LSGLGLVDRPHAGAVEDSHKANRTHALVFGTFGKVYEAAHHIGGSAVSQLATFMVESGLSVRIPGFSFGKPKGFCPGFEYFDSVSVRIHHITH
jgi:hypothetical protein